MVIFCAILVLVYEVQLRIVLILCIVGIDDNIIIQVEVIYVRSLHFFNRLEDKGWFARLRLQVHIRLVVTLRVRIPLVIETIAISIRRVGISR